MQFQRKSIEVALKASLKMLSLCQGTIAKKKHFPLRNVAVVKYFGLVGIY